MTPECIPAAIIGLGGVLGIVLLARRLDMQRKAQSIPTSDSVTTSTSSVFISSGKLRTPVPARQIGDPKQVVELYQKSYQNLKSWGGFVLFIGVANTIMWGIAYTSLGSKIPFSLPLTTLLIVVGGMMLYYREPVMYAVAIPVYILTELPEFLIESRTFNIMTIVRVCVLAVLLFMMFGSRQVALQYAALPDEFKTEPLPDRARHVFPLYGLVLGLVVLVGSVIAGVALHFASEAGQPDGWVSIVSGFIALLGILGFAISLASLWHNFPRKAFSVIGLLLGGWVVVDWLIQVIQRFRTL